MMTRVLLCLSLTSFAWAKPNIVLILTDDMSWTGTSVQMDPQTPESKSDFYLTPNIETLASQGMSFSAAYSPGPMCTPSRAGILTGKTPAELRMTTPGGGRAHTYHRLVSPDFVRQLPTEETTIAEALKQQGYATAHLGKWHLGHTDPGEHGFDVHDGATENESAGEPANPKDVFGITERAIGFMTEQVESQTPFYLQLSHYAVHSPTEALEVSKEKFAGITSGERHTDSEYAAMTWDLDVSIGLLLKAIDDLNLSESTYVVLMSDNGGPGNRRRSQNKPLKLGKGTLYEGGIRVPLIVRGPEIEPASYNQVPVTGCDLFPTFCEWADSPIPSGLEGNSIVPLLNCGTLANRSLLFHYPHYGGSPLHKPQSALIAGKYKILKDYDSGTTHLYDLESDLREEVDLSDQLPEKKEELETLLGKRLAAIDAGLPTENQDYDPDAVQERRGKRSR